MNTDFRIGLISDDPYHSGLLKGYCQAHRYKIFETAADTESINTMIQMQPNIIILAIGLSQDQAQKNNFDLIRQMSIKHQIPVCYLRDVNNAANSGEDPACWVDTTLDAPLNINQLNDYLHSKFKHHHLFIREKRNRERRTANDRRLLMLNQQNKVPGNNHPANKNMPNNDDTDCFTVEPFQIDQRSKSVFF